MTDEHKRDYAREASGDIYGQTVTVIYHDAGPDGWWADSPDVEGYAASGATLSEVRELVLEGLPFFLGTDDDVPDVEIDERFPTAVLGVKVDTPWDSAPDLLEKAIARVAELVEAGSALEEALSEQGRRGYEDEGVVRAALANWREVAG